MILPISSASVWLGGDDAAPHIARGHPDVYCRGVARRSASSTCNFDQGTQWYEAFFRPRADTFRHVAAALSSFLEVPIDRFSPLVARSTRAPSPGSDHSRTWR